MNDCIHCGKAVAIIRRYLPPDGTSMAHAMQELIELFDPPQSREGWRCGECNLLNEAKNEFCFDCGESEANRGTVK